MAPASAGPGQGLSRSGLWEPLRCVVVGAIRKKEDRHASQADSARSRGEGSICRSVYTRASGVTVEWWIASVDLGVVEQVGHLGVGEPDDAAGDDGFDDTVMQPRTIVTAVVGIPDRVEG